MRVPELWLNGNPLAGLPASIERCRSLSFVNLEGTLIYALPLELSRVASLVSVALTPAVLKPKLAGAYASGTKRLMEYLAKKDEKRALRANLMRRLRLDVYREAALTEAGSAKIGVSPSLHASPRLPSPLVPGFWSWLLPVCPLSAAFVSSGGTRFCSIDGVLWTMAEALASSILKTFPSLDDIVLVTRNLERLFHSDLDKANAPDASARLEVLRRENAVKKLAADLELRLRQIYFDVIRVEAVEGIIKSIYEHVRGWRVQLPKRPASCGARLLSLALRSFHPHSPPLTYSAPTLLVALVPPPPGPLLPAHAQITELEDVRFLLHFATQLFPKSPADIDGRVLLRDLQVCAQVCCLLWSRQLLPAL